MPQKLRALALRLLGSRRLSPFGAEIQALSFDAGLRTRENWLVPALTVLVLATIVALGRFATTGLDGFGRIFMRIFVIDIGFFVFAWISGWNTARRWRTNPDLMEEITLTPLRPVHFFHAAATGPLAAWVVAVAAFLAIDGAMAVFGNSDGATSLAGGANPFVQSFGHPFALAALLVMLSLSHLESVRLSHALFVCAAIPNVSLTRLAWENLFKIAGIVVSLSALGCMVTGLLALPMYAGFSLTFYENPTKEEFVWALCSAPVLWMVLSLKRDIASRELRDFTRNMLLFQWHGAAETEFPARYPDGWVALAQFNSALFEMEEANEAPGVPKRERLRLQKRFGMISERAMRPTEVAK